MSRVWFIMTEVRALPGMEFPKAGARAIVECYVPEHHIEVALDRARRALADEHFQLLDVTRCLCFDLNDWDYDQHPRGSNARVVAERVIEHDTVEFGPFCGPFSDVDDLRPESD